MTYTMPDVWPVEETDGFVLGRKLNTVQHGPRGGRPSCPHCHVAGPMTVFEFGVRWACGCIRPLPLLPEAKREILELKRKATGPRRDNKGERGRRAA